MLIYYSVIAFETEQQFWLASVSGSLLSLRGDEMRTKTVRQFTLPAWSRCFCPRLPSKVFAIGV